MANLTSLDFSVENVVRGIAGLRSEIAEFKEAKTKLEAQVAQLLPVG